MVFIRSSRSRLASFLLLLWTSAALAAPIPVPAPPQINATSYVLMDFDSGRLLASSNPDQRVEPASITKVMTAYVTFRQLADGNLKLDEQVTISEKAWRSEGSRTFLKVGSQIDVETLIKGMIVQSGNDASIALAEHIAGAEESFAGLMNQYAQQIGMRNSHFMNATGLPDPNHYTTAHDIALLAQAMIRDFPEQYRWYSIRSFLFNGIEQSNRNRLLWRDASVDGLKTGHTSSAGYCLAASAKRDQMRLITVVMGAPSDNARMNDSQALLNYGFRFYSTHRLYGAGDTVIEAPVWMGKVNRIGLGLKKDLYITVPRGQYEGVQTQAEVQERLVAPLTADAPIGKLVVRFNDDPLLEAPLYPQQAVEKGNLFKRLWHWLLMWFK
ncbi:MAG TPA: D-alanyl-D-alanine carboxypeptidase family protein [Candidatus Acidoferrales bacterium]|nr:D-alanyl-D-alanine carboxypeptidase family protein [Candidatus Acidoferrales bacterium]